MDSGGARRPLDGARHPTARGRAAGLPELPLRGVLQGHEESCPSLPGECTTANAGELRGRMLGEQGRLHLRWAGIRAGVVSENVFLRPKSGLSTSRPLLLARAAAVSVGLTAVASGFSCSPAQSNVRRLLL